MWRASRWLSASRRWRCRPPQPRIGLANPITWRWSLSSIGIDSEENCDKVLTQFSSTTKGRRGRPSEISDDELRRAFNDLQFVLEENWATVGWALRQAKKLENIPKVLSGIVGITCSRLDPFRKR